MELKNVKETNYRILEFSRTLVNTLREPVIIINEEYDIIASNSSFYKFFELEDRQELSLFRLLGNSHEIGEFRQFLIDVFSDQYQITDLSIPALRKNSSKDLLVNASKLEWEQDHDQFVLISFKEYSGLEGNFQQIKKSIRGILEHAPAFICTLSGPDHIFELANEKFIQLAGNRQVIGKSVHEALPEIENQGFIRILDQVYSSGEPFIGQEIFVEIKQADASTKDSYLDFVYQPTTDLDGKVEGIFVHGIDVTEKVLARKKLEENKKRLKNLIDTLPAIIWIGDKEGNSSYLNKNWYELTGQTREEAKDRGWLAAIHPDDREETSRKSREANLAQSSFVVIFRVRHKDGFYKWMVNRGSPNISTDGEYEGMIGTLVDINEEKIKEQLIKEKDHRIRNIIEESTVATALYTGSDLTIEIANDAMIDLWGKDRRVIGKPLEEALPELEGQPYTALLEEVLKTGKIYWGKEDKVDLMMGDQMKTGYYNFTYKPLRDEAGEIYGILNMALDVTETVESKNLLAESESYFRQMADLMPDKVSSTDPGGKPDYFNRNWLDYTGLDSDTLKDLGWSEFVHPQEKEKFDARWQQSLKTGNNFEMELRYLSKEGTYKWHLSRFEAVRDEAGKIKMWIGTNTEIQRIKEEEKRKEDFLKMVSHELKTPITSIKGYVQLLLSQLKKEEERTVPGLPLKPSLERIDHQVRKLTRLISEMLDLSRLEEKKLRLEKEHFLINDLVRETVQDIKYTSTQHRVNIHDDYRCTVHADRDRIGQVLINFIINAIKYSPENPVIDIFIEKAGEDMVNIRVKDNGIGIDKKDQKNIFRRFYRIGGKNRDTYSGFGIGLFLANEIIGRHNGEICVKSQKGKGSDFSFKLDVAPNI